MAGRANDREDGRVLPRRDRQRKDSEVAAGRTEPRQAQVGKRVTLLLPPQHINVPAEIKKALSLHKLTTYEEIEPAAGCRRFRLS